MPARSPRSRHGLARAAASGHGSVAGGRGPRASACSLPPGRGRLGDGGRRRPAPLVELRRHRRERHRREPGVFGGQPVHPLRGASAPRGRLIALGPRSSSTAADGRSTVAAARRPAPQLRGLGLPGMAPGTWRTVRSARCVRASSSGARCGPRASASRAAVSASSASPLGGLEFLQRSPAGREVRVQPPTPSRDAQGGQGRLLGVQLPQPAPRRPSVSSRRALISGKSAVYPLAEAGQGRLSRAG